MGWFRKRLIDGIREDEPVLTFQVMGMKIAGMWPLDDNTHRGVKFLYRLYFKFTFICLVLTSVLSLSAVMSKMSLGSLASTVDILTTFVTAAFKMIIMRRNKENMLNILKEVQSLPRNSVVGDKGPSFFQHTRGWPIMGWFRNLIDGVREDEPVLTFQVIGMRTSGTWPLDNNTHKAVKFLYRLYVNFTFICLVLTSVLSLSAVMAKMSLGSLASTVDILTMFATAAFKMIIMKKNEENMLNILKEVRSFSRNSVVGDKGPSFYQHTRFSKLFSLLHQGIGGVVITGWIFSPIIEKVNYPVVVWTPEGTEDTLFYPLVYLVTGWSLLVAAHVYLSQDSYLFSLLHICCFHINQIGHGLQAVDKLPSNKVAKNNNKLEGLKKLAAFHAKILNLLKTVEYNWRSMLVADLFHCIMSLSFGLFNTSVTSSLPARIKTYFFITYSFFHEFLNSYFGEMLVSHENMVSEWLYEMDWLSMSIDERKHVLFMMTRAQRPVKINAWQVYDFSYPMFMELTKALLSYYMVLKTLLDKSTI